MATVARATPRHARSHADQPGSPGWRPSEWTSRTWSIPLLCMTGHKGAQRIGGGQHELAQVTGLEVAGVKARQTSSPLGHRNGPRGGCPSLLCLAALIEANRRFL